MNDKQKRALGVGAVGVVGLLAYRQQRRKGSARTTLTNGLAQASSPVGSTTPFVPQAPIVVPPGESIYDPNSQNLLNTPSINPPQSVTPGGPSYVVNVAPPRAHGTRRKRQRAATRTVTARTNQQHKAKSKRHKPKATVSK